MKKFKKVISMLICLALIMNLSAFSASANDTSYPYIFVHGMGGWGSADPFYEHTAYWGGGLNIFSDTDLMKILNSRGIEAYAPSVGPLSSAWDRACELYAQLTGTVVDYGAAHSAAHKHDRYGYSYEGKAIMGESWNLKDKINLVGHSFGGETVRLLTSLLAYGDKEEISATGNDTSELFKGGYDDVIHSCITLSSPHNGSQVANFVFDSKPLFYAICTALNFAGATLGDYVIFSLQLGHFGIGPKQNEETAKFDFKKIYNFYSANDNCGYDMTLRGARELNEKIKLSPNTYYYSFSTAATVKSALTGTQVPIITTNPIFLVSTLMIASTEGKIIDGVKIEGNWLVNDGIVPLESALYPHTDKSTAEDYEESLLNNEKIETGRWYYLDTMYGMDHFDFCGTKDYPISFEGFYLDMIELANSR